MRTTLAILAVVGTVLATLPASAQEDPHKVYERRCNGCHVEHGADLARQKFKLDHDVLSVARTGARVDVLLRKHHGVTLTGAETAALLTLFKSGIQWAGVYQRLCARCHDKAVGFARERLVLRDGQIVSRKSGVDVGEMLKQHGGATDAEIATLLEMLRYQLATDANKAAE
jgi:cytochrome c5